MNGYLERGTIVACWRSRRPVTERTFEWMLDKLPNAEFGVAEVARALKLSVIRAAKDAGLRKLRTNNEERNEPMRRLNEELGYRPEPGQIGFRGPIG